LTRETDAAEEYLLTTAGLSSARQMIDTTGAEVYSVFNTSSVSTIQGFVLAQPHMEPSTELPSHEGEKAAFATALLESLAKNRKIIDELAKR
jgi:hypothetical protein